MLKTFPQFAVAACAALLLAACGEGGDGYDDRVGGDKRRQHDIDRIAGSADTLLLSDLLISTDSFGEVRARSECTGTVCTLNLRNLEEFVSLSDLTGESAGAWPEAESKRYGVSIAREAGFGEFDGTIATGEGWAGWLEHNAFLVGHATFREDGVGTVQIPLSMSIGVATGRNPARGSARWTGAMVGVDKSKSSFNTVRGRADLTISIFADRKLDVTFSEIRHVDGGPPLKDMHWRDVPMTDGGFETGYVGNSIKGKIKGKFYGPDHLEAGGIFERNKVIGAFGAKRR